MDWFLAHHNEIWFGFAWYGTGMIVAGAIKGTVEYFSGKKHQRKA